MSPEHTRDVILLQVKLVSAENFEFIIDYKAACVSNTIRNMLSSQGEACGYLLKCFLVEKRTGLNLWHYQ